MCLEDGAQRQEPEAAEGAALFDPVGVGELFAEHLVAAADAEDRHVAGGQLLDSGLEARLPEPQQVGHSAFRAGEDDEVRRPQFLRGLHVAQAEDRVVFQRREVREVRDLRQTEDGHVHRPLRRFDAQRLCQRILFVEFHPEVRDDAQRRDSGQLAELVESVAEEAYIAAEFIDEQAFDPLFFVRFEEGHRAVELREHAAPVDVARQQDRRVHEFREAHVDEVVLFEVDLRGAPCPFDDDDVVLFRQRLIRLEDGRDEFRFERIVFRRRHVLQHFSVHDDLAPGVRAGLQEDRVHADVRLFPAGGRLDHLGPAHLEAVVRHVAVEGHVLALERSDPVAVFRKDAAEGRHQKALSGTGHGALYHDRLSHVPAPPSKRG